MINEIKTKIGIIGAGRWGGTLAKIFADYGHEVLLFCLESEELQLNSKRQILHTKNFSIPKSVKITADKSLAKDCEIVFMAIPGKIFKDVWNEYEDCIQDAVVVNASKMIDFDENDLILPHQIIQRENYAHFASAAFPEGLSQNSPTIGTLFSKNDMSEVIKNLFPQSLLRVYTSEDVIGGEIGAALKNVIAIASGAANQLGFDEMTRASLASRGAREIRIFAEQHGAASSTFADGSTFLADLIGTCFSKNSHNYKAGEEIVFGLPLEVIEHGVGTVEGFHTLSVLNKIGAFPKMPISNAVYSMVYGKLSQKEAIDELLSRSIKHE